MEFLPSMKWMRLILGASVVAFLVLIVGLVVVGVARHGSPWKETERSHTSGRGRTTGLSFRSVGEGEGTAFLEAREIVDRKRKIGPLTINPLSEIRMTDVTIEIEVPPDDPGVDLVPPAIGNLLESGLASRGLSFPTRVVIEPFRLLVRREGAGWELRGSRMTLESASGDATFERGFSLRTQADHYLTGKKAKWVSGRKCLVVSGRYAVRDSDGARTDRGGVFRIDRDGRLLEQIEPRR